jgi:hypothetical protein
MPDSKFLRRILIADAVISGASGILMLTAANALSQLLGVPAELLRSAGLSLIPFTAFVVWICTRAAIPRTSVWTVIALNVAWVLASVALLFVDRLDPNRLGVAFIVLQAVAVAGFAEMQYVGLRRQLTRA